MGDAWIVSAARTPIGSAFKGTLVDVDPIDLATTAVSEAVRRSGIDPELIDDVVLAEYRVIAAGGGTGVAAMCAGGGMSSAVVIDVPAA